MNSSFCTDARTVQRAGRFEVLTARHEIMWPDGSTVHLHPVRHTRTAYGAAVAGEPDTFLRALALPGRAWVIFDLRDLARTLDAEIRQHLPRNVPGLVYYTLRLQYRNAADLTAFAIAHAQASCVMGQAELAA